jgi:hypothetical protein
MGGFVGDVLGGVGDVLGGVGDIAGNALQGVANNPLGAGLSLATGNYAPLIGSALGGAMGSSGGGVGNYNYANSYMPQQGGYNSGSSMMGPQPIIINNTPGQTQQDQSQGMFSQLLPFLLQAGGGLAQGQVNKDAAQTQANALRAAGQQASQGAQFRPVGTTTRFGSSNFQIDPSTGQIQSAGYNLSPEMLGYQNRLSGLASQGLTQAEGAQAQYAPLQQGAQSMFGLGNQYLGSQLGQPVTDLGRQYMQSQTGAPLTQAGLGYLNQSPQAAAQDWYTKQQALLNPSRDVESARLANQLQQTGRTGVSVAQGGGLGAANPEQQALANARAMQDAQLAANAGQYGLQQQQAGANLYGQGNALTQGAQLAGAGLYGTGQGLTQQGQQFGAGLFGTGAQNLGNYYAGQTAAMSPYNAAIAGVQGLEQAGQQPFNMSTALAQQQAAAGANAGRLGYAGAQDAANAVLRANQVSPFADILSALGKTPTATSAIGSAAGGLLGGLFGGNASAGQGDGGGSYNTGSNGYGDFGSFNSDALNFGGYTGNNNQWAGSPEGLTGYFKVGNQSKNNPYAGILGPNETWMGE